jgi:hypothetical protein
VEKWYHLNYALKGFVLITAGTMLRDGKGRVRKEL